MVAAAATAAERSQYICIEERIFFKKKNYYKVNSSNVSFYGTGCVNITQIEAIE
jgi:hypothetical protein